MTTMDKKGWLLPGWLLLFSGLVWMALSDGNAESYNFVIVAATHSWKVALILFAIVIPIVEEIIFRGWGLVPKETDFDYRTTVIGITVISAAVLALFWSSPLSKLIAIAVLVIMIPLIAIAFGAHGSHHTHSGIILFFLGTTIVFILLHIIPLGRITLATLPQTISLAGLSSLCIVMAKRRKFLIGIVIHICFNLTIALCYMVPRTAYDNISFETKDAHVELIRLSEYKSFSSNAYNNFVECGGLDKIAVKLGQKSCNDINSFCPTLYLSDSKKDYLSYRMTVTHPDSCDIAQICYDILKEMINNRMIKSDTIYSRKLYLDFKDMPYANKSNPVLDTITVKDLIYLLRDKYSLPVFPSRGINTECPILGNTTPVNEHNIVSSIENKYNILIKEAPYDKSCIITFHCN